MDTNVLARSTANFAVSHNCDDCLKYSEGDSDDSCFDRNYSDQEFGSRGCSEIGYPTVFPVYDIKADGPPVNIFSDEEFVHSEAEMDFESEARDDFARISDMFSTLVNFLRNVELYVTDESQMSKEEMHQEVASMKNMLKQNADCFFDMADFMASKHATRIDSCNTGKSSSVEKPNHKTGKTVESSDDSSSGSRSSRKKTDLKTPAEAGRRRTSGLSNKSKNSPTKNKKKTKISPKTQKRSDGRPTRSGGKRKSINEEAIENERRRSSRIPVRRKIYHNGMRLFVDSDGSVLVPSSTENDKNEGNVRKTSSRKALAALKRKTNMAYPSGSRSEYGVPSASSRGRKSLPAKCRRSFFSETTCTTSLDGNKSLPNKSRRSLFSMDSWLHSLNEIGIGKLT